MTERALTNPTSAFTAFWIFRSTSPVNEDREARVREALAALEKRPTEIELRGVYATTGFTAGADVIVWVVAPDLALLQTLAFHVRGPFRRVGLELTLAYPGMASVSQYDRTHGPAFLRHLPPKKYLSLYPFTKTPEWYLLPYEQRHALMVDHGAMGKEFPTVLTNTVSSFGIADHEFVVALEDDDPSVLISMVQRLRAAEVRRYTQVDTPVFLGLLADPADVLIDVGR